MLRRHYSDIFQYVSRTESTEVSIWRHFALAASISTEATCREPKFPAWAPQMIALHRRPSARLLHNMSNSFLDTLHTSADLPALLEGKELPSPDQAPAYAFCFAARALSFQLPEDGSVDTFYCFLAARASCIWNCSTLMRKHMLRNYKEMDHCFD